MANISLDLSQFKASGVYTLEYDQSENIILAPQTVRLVVGFSKKGPFNTPVFCQDIKTARIIFGDIDKSLERKGSFFHRALATTLQLGPCFALNLLALDNDSNTGDKSVYKSFSVDTAEANGTPASKLLSSYFNKERFWFADTEYFLGTVNGTGTKPEDFAGDKAKLLHFTNVGQVPISIIVRKSNIKGFDISVKEWYGQVGIEKPEFLNEQDFISDFFVDVIAIKGDWSDHVKLADDPTFGTYFDKNGLIQSKLTDFLSISEVTLVGSFTGTIIPDFLDQNGINQFIETIINGSVGTTGLFCAVNKNAIDELSVNASKIDLVGHHLIDALTLGQEEINFLSYRAPLVEDNLFAKNETTFGSLKISNDYISLPTTDLVGSPVGNELTVSGSSAFAAAILALEVEQCFFVDTKGSPVENYKLKITDITEIGNDIVITFVGDVNALFVNGGNYIIGNNNAVYRKNTGSPLLYEVLAYEKSPLYQGWINGEVQDGDIIYKNVSGDEQYLRFTKFVDSDGFTYVAVEAYVDAGFLGKENITDFDLTYKFNSTSSSFELVVGSPDPVIDIISLFGTYNEFFDTLPETGLQQNEVVVAVADSKKLKVGDLLQQDSAESRLTRILTISTYNVFGDVKIKTAQPIKIFASNRIQKFTKIPEFVKEVQFTYLEGFKLKSSHIPDGSDIKLQKILGVLSTTNLTNALKDTDIITFRYVVDTFNGGLSPEGQSAKAELTNLARKRQKCMAFLNLPSIKEFSDSVDPRFTDEPTLENPVPLLNTKYIADGGNLSLNPSFTWKLNDEGDGSKFSGWFSPNLIVRDAGKNISIPPAAHVSNLFVQKFIDGTPFAIVAGSRRGIIQGSDLVGTEYDFVLEDREFLEPIGVNPIIKKKGQGIMVFANQTAFQKTNSAFNNLHVRDILITVESDIESILQNYLFEFNDDSTRLEVKSIVDNFLEGVQAAGGIFNFLTIMDSSNNTNQIIDQNIGIIDVIVEPARGIQKFINRVTVTKTGGISSGGFTVA
jgi:hypothetical protein